MTPGNPPISEFVTKSMQYALKCHDDTNHKYDGHPYSNHLQMVYDYGCKYQHLILNRDVDAPLAACWTHDVIEDARQTYNDVKGACGIQVAEITYALTNEKGKNRSERANDKYYRGICDISGALFVKLCDRLANINYSKISGSTMLDRYRKEHSNFKNKLYDLHFHPMFEEMENLLKS